MQTNKMIEKIINGMNDKIETLENKVEENDNYKKLWEENTKDYNILARKRLSDYESNTELKKDIKVLYKSYDELESKYFKLLQAIDELRKDGETITIKELRRFKDWEEFNETMKEGHETIKRVKNNKLKEVK